MPRPSEFYQRHHNVEPPAIDGLSFRPYWRLVTRLDQLLLDRAISQPEWRAARMFGQYCAIVQASAWRTQSLDRTPGSDPMDNVLVTRRIDARKRLQMIRAALSRQDYELLELCTVDDPSWVNLAARYRVHPKTVRAWTISAIGALSVVWRT
jgi:hypothetical protein